MLRSYVLRYVQEVNMHTLKAVRILEHAGKHLVKSRGSEVYGAARSLNATQAARSTNPDVQALAVLSVLLYRAVGSQQDGWVDEITAILGME
jgi:hypothetical protein